MEENKWKRPGHHIYDEAIKNKFIPKTKNYYESIIEQAEKKAFNLQLEGNIVTNENLKKFSIANKIKFFDRRELFCNDYQKKCSIFTKDGYRIRYDYGHLTLEGRVELSKLLLENNFKNLLIEMSNEVQSKDFDFIPYAGSLR